MSKGNKDSEKLLEEALVHEENQPYELPANWVWTKLGKIANYYNGKVFKSAEWSNKGRPIVRIQDLTGTNKGEPNYFEGEVAEKHEITKGDLLVSWAATLGVYIWNGSDAVLNQHIFKVETFIDKKYQYYAMQSIIASLYNRTHGSGMVHVTKKVFDETPFPLPNLKEQKRITERLERLLSKIEEVKQLIDEAHETFELRRAAILDKAFRGELTKGLHVKVKNENNENGIRFNDNTEEFYRLPYNWKWVSLESVCESITDGDHQAPPKSEEGIPFLVISNINKGVLDFQETRFVSEEYYNNLHAKRMPKFGDVLYSVTGSYGIPVLVDTDKKFCFQRHIAILKPSKDISSKYLYYILKSRLVYNQATNYATGTAQLTVPLSGLRKIKIPLPSLNEQNYIVEKIERMFNKQANAEKSCIISNENIEVLKQSIVSKSFKGELGTNDPSEENAIELLKEVLQSNK